MQESLGDASFESTSYAYDWITHSSLRCNRDILWHVEAPLALYGIRA